MIKLSKQAKLGLGWMVFVSALGILFMLTAFPFFTGEHTKTIVQHVTGLDERTAYEVNAVARKAVHVLIFGLLALLLHRIFRTKSLSRAWACTVVLAGLDEWHQSFVPGRTPSIRDVLLDSAAALVFLLVMTWWRKR
ncbi:VanZ family protein [Paenibacillus rigui]|nr:VanZ family protein [Paenibacillus rigui]